MAILDLKEKIEPFRKNATGYVKQLLSSDHVVMSDGTTLQTKMDSLNSALSNATSSLGTVNNSISSINSSISTITNKPYYFAAGDFYYSGNFCFYKYGNGVIQINAMNPTMKVNVDRGKYTLIGYIPKECVPGYEFYFPVFYNGTILGMLALTTSGNICLFPYADTQGKEMCVNGCYVGF